MQIIKTTENDYHTPAVVTKEEWKNILSNKSFMKRSYTDALIAFYLEDKHESTCKNLSERYNKHHNFFNASISQFAKQVQKNLDEKVSITFIDSCLDLFEDIVKGEETLIGLTKWKILNP